VTTELTELRQRLAELTIGERPAIRLNEIVAAPIPRGVKAYIQGETVRLLEHDLRNAPSFRHVDVTTPGTTSLARSFLRSLSYGYIFDRQVYLEMLEEAVVFVANFLFRPQWMLEKFLLEEGPKVSTELLETKLAFLSDYGYFGDILMRILRRRKAEEVSAEELRTLITRIDEQIVRQHNPRELASLARPIFSFLLLNEGVAERPIPIDPLLLFFDDKKLQFLRDYIDGICKVRKTTVITMKDLTTLIEDLYSAEVKPVEPVIEQPPPSPEPEESPTSNGPLHPEPLVEEPPPILEEEVPEPLNPPIMAEHTRNVGLTDLTALMSDQQRKRFIRKIFQKDEDYFRSVLRTLDDLMTWEEAKTYLKDFFLTNDLDPYAADVVEFTDLVQQRYPRHPESAR
jgi:hypothetical protein